MSFLSTTNPSLSSIAPHFIVLFKSIDYSCNRTSKILYCIVDIIILYTDRFRQDHSSFHNF